MRGEGKPGSSPQQITRLWTQQGNWPPTQLQALQPGAMLRYTKNNIFFTNLANFFICLYFTNLITFSLLLLFVFISLKHNKL